MAEWSKAAVSKTAKMVTSSRVRILPGLLKELGYCVMVSTSDFGSDSLGSNPGSPAKLGYSIRVVRLTLDQKVWVRILLSQQMKMSG